jgi:hypothetical protein
LVVLLAQSSALVAAASCDDVPKQAASGSSADSNGTGDNSSDPSSSSSSAGGSGPTSSSSGSTSTSSTDTPLFDAAPPPAEAGIPAEAGVCTLPAIDGVADVTPTYTLIDPKNGVSAPVPTGGNTQGTFKVDKATVFLPSSLKGLVKTDTSTGTVNSWATFDGARLRLSMHADLKIDSKKGIQEQKNDVTGAGTFALQNGIITVETTCDGAPLPTDQVSFSDLGARGQLIFKITTSRGDVYLVLEGPRS